MGKGVSAAEKKERMLKLFRDSKEVLTKKEVESRSTKVGIISNAVEGVLKELVGDDLVREEKVGISTYWWSFPGEDAAKKRRELSAEFAEEDLTGVLAHANSNLMRNRRRPR